MTDSKSIMHILTDNIKPHGPHLTAIIFPHEIYSEK